MGREGVVEIGHECEGGTISNREDLSGWRRRSFTLREEVDLMPKSE